MFQLKILQTLSKIFKFLSHTYEYFALMLATLVFLFILSKNYTSYLFLSVASIIGLIFFIVFKRHFVNVDLKEENYTYLFSPHKHTFSIIFFIFYSLSLLALLDGFYTKTIWYYLFVSVCTASIAMDILFINSKYTAKGTLLKCVLLFLNLSISNQILYPLGIGNPDNFYHVYGIIMPIIESGKVPIGYVYSGFPMHHLLIVSTMYFIQPHSPLLIYNLLGAFLMSLAVIVIFLIGRMIVDVRFGLLSALLYCCCDYLIYWGSHPSHLSYMYSAILVFFFLLLKILYDKKVSTIVLCIIMSTYIIFLHHYSAFIMFFMLMSILLVELFFKTKLKEYKIKSFGIFTIFILMLLTHWMYYSVIFNKFVNIADLYLKAFSSDILTYSKSITYYDTFPLRNLLLNEVGSSIFLCLSVIGLFYFIRHRSLFSNIVSLLFVILLFLIGIGSILNLYYLLPNRIYAFMQELSMVFLASVSILWIIGNINRHQNAKKIIFVLFILLLQFFSSSSTIAGFETSIFVGEQPYWKIYETDYERNSLLWIERNYDANILNNNISASPSIVVNPHLISKIKIPFTNYRYYENGDDILVDTGNVSSNSYIVFNKFDEIIGFNFGRMGDSEYHVGSSRKTKTNSNTKKNLDLNSDILQVYNNGMLTVYRK